MGTWGVGSFANDAASDWVYELEHVEDLSYVEETLTKIVTIGSEYLEAPEAEEAIAAADVLARLKGAHKGDQTDSEAVADWVAAHPQQPPAGLVSIALQALERITTPPSELLELWMESKDFEKWKDEISALKAALVG